MRGFMRRMIEGEGERGKGEGEGRESRKGSKGEREVIVNL